MRRRNQLRPDTFPFLAVLLCTMGSLILILLILDRRARMVARSRVEAALAKTEQEEADKAAQVRTQLEELRRARLQAFHTQRNNLQAQEVALQSEYDHLLQQLHSLLTAFAAEKVRFLQDENRREVEQQSVVHTEKQLAHSKQQLAQSKQALQNTRLDLNSLVADLERLEIVLKQVQQQRKREQKTWSVVPYAGNRGQNRRPLYVECAAEGLIFHPDGLKLTEPKLSPQSILKEVEERTARQKQLLPAGSTSYWLLLIRPNGILRYYQFLQSVASLDLSFGYELIDTGWLLEFPDVTGNEMANQDLPPSPAPRGSGSPRGSKPSGTPQSVGRGSRSGPSTVAGLPGQEKANTIGTPPSPRGTEPGNSIGKIELLPPRTPGKVVPAREQRPAGQAGEPKAPLPTEQATPQTPKTPKPEALGPIPPGERKPEEEEGQPGTPGTGGSPKRPLRPARVGGPHEWVIIVECKADRVSLSSPPLDIPVITLQRGGEGGALLLSTIQGMLAKRQARLRSDDRPLEPLIRFLVHRDGLRAFHLAYPALNGLAIPKLAVYKEE